MFSKVEKRGMMRKIRIEEYSAKLEEKGVQ
jgi:hypothetical protein